MLTRIEELVRQRNKLVRKDELSYSSRQERERDINTIAEIEAELIEEGMSEEELLALPRNN